MFYFDFNGNICLLYKFARECLFTKTLCPNHNILVESMPLPVQSNNLSCCRSPPNNIINWLDILLVIVWGWQYLVELG